MRNEWIVAVMALLLFAPTLRADDSSSVLDDKASAKKPAHIIYEKEQNQEFSGAKLKGQLKKPDLSYIYQRKGLRAEKIVNVPEDFDEDIISGAGQF